MTSKRRMAEQQPAQVQLFTSAKQLNQLIRWMKEEQDERLHRNLRTHEQETSA
jgi:hypothetical protein